MIWTFLTRRQGGLVARTQLEALGMPAPAIDGALAVGVFERTRSAGVVRARGAPFTPDTPAWFAVLATRSPLSFASAAVWWGLPVEPDGLVHVTRPGRRRLDWPDHVRVHRVLLRAGDVTEHRGLPVTTRAETVLDCLGHLPFGAAAALADRARQQAWLCGADVEQRLTDQPGRWGNRQLRRLLPHLDDGAAAESERRLHQLLRDAAVTGWKPNVRLTLGSVRMELDVAFEAALFAIEVDGRRYHSEDDRFQADRTKQNALVAAGWTVLRFTWADIVERPHDVVAQIRAVLAAA